MIRRLAVLLLVLTLTAPAIHAKGLNARQLVQMVAELHNLPDVQAERHLGGLVLTERVSQAKVQHALKALPGPLSRRALNSLTAASSFLNLPSEDRPRLPPMNGAQQQQTLALASTYVEKTLSKLPNFFATEVITLFEDTLAFNDGARFTAYRPLHFENARNATVLYRGGQEIMETAAGEIVEKDQVVSTNSGLLSSGEFGPVLATVLKDAGKGHLTWSHWESASPSPMAVFRYAVPRKESHYRVKVELADQSKPFQTRPGYHGEIGIDPATGTILRITLRADMIDDDPLGTADLLVEYGPVVIGGVSYICPLRSVAIVVTGRFALGGSNGGDNSMGLNAGALYPPNSKDFPAQTLINNVEFERYHLLRSEAKILTGADTQDTPDQP